jgi:hypothetical protein
MSRGTPDSLIPYDEIVQDALRAVVGRVLGQIEKGGGLPGAHHFYITFKTQRRASISRASDRSLSGRDDDRPPEPLLGSARLETGFEVGLSFNQVGSKLSIPFAAITAFHDPAVDFALHFSAQVENQEPEEIAEAENDPVVRSSEDGSNVVSVDFTRKK